MRLIGLMSVVMLREDVAGAGADTDALSHRPDNRAALEELAP